MQVQVQAVEEPSWASAWVVPEVLLEVGVTGPVKEGAAMAVGAAAAGIDAESIPPLATSPDVLGRHGIWSTSSGPPVLELAMLCKDTCEDYSCMKKQVASQCTQNVGKVAVVGLSEQLMLARPWSSPSPQHHPQTKVGSDSVGCW